MNTNTFSKSNCKHITIIPINYIQNIFRIIPGERILNLIFRKRNIPKVSVARRWQQAPRAHGTARHHFTRAPFTALEAM